MLFKDIYVFNSGDHFVQWSITVLGNCGRWHYEEHFCEIILNLDQCLRKI